MEQSAPATPPARPSTNNKRLKSVNVNNLGVFLDGWAELIEGRGDRAAEVKELVHAYLDERNMPDVNVNKVNGSAGIGTQKRPYNITTTHPSATTAIYVGQHGHDMYVSWRTFIKPQLSVAIILIGLFALIAGLYSGFRTAMIQINPLIYQVSDDQRLLAGLTAFIVAALIVFSLLTFFVAALGRVIKGNAAAFFFEEPNVFDAEDITAMSLSAHKSLLRALDATDIDVTQLRLKQNFKGGRASETV